MTTTISIRTHQRRCLGINCEKLIAKPAWFCAVCRNRKDNQQVASGRDMLPEPRDIPTGAIRVVGGRVLRKAVRE